MAHLDSSRGVVNFWFPPSHAICKAWGAAHGWVHQMLTEPTKHFIGWSRTLWYIVLLSIKENFAKHGKNIYSTIFFRGDVYDHKGSVDGQNHVYRGCMQPYGNRVLYLGKHHPNQGSWGRILVIFDTTPKHGGNGHWMVKCQNKIFKSKG